MTVAEIEGSRIFKKLILEWWTENKRNFPWRTTKDPYKILCSEIMLQQTNAEKVERVYKEFTAQYPKIEDLNKADLEKIEEFIQPLGLIKRAHTLKNIAEIIIKEYGGQVPNNKSSLMELPGVGHYIADAVRCFAYEQVCGVLDTNTIRILERVFGIVSDKSRPRTDSKLREQLNSLVGDSRCRDYNYALLDFASTICRKRSPKCSDCPVGEMCSYIEEKNE